MATILNPGDSAFVGFNSDGNDNLAFVTLVPIEAGTQIHFTDNEWTGSSFNTGESGFTWTAGSAIPAGTIVAIDNIGTGTTTSNLGTVAFFDSTNRGIANSTEIIYAYVGTPTTPTAFLTAIGNNTLTGTGGGGTTVTLSGTGLTVGVNAIELVAKDVDADVATYTGSRTGLANFSDYRALINDPINWVTQDASGDQSADGIAPDVPFSVSAFAVSAPSVNLSVSSTTGSEAGQIVITVTATASSAVTSNQTVNLDVSGTNITTGDYTLNGAIANNVTITIPSGSTTGTATFTVVDDTLVEGSETATLTLSNPSAGITLGNTIAQTVAISDNDVIPTVNFSVSATTGSEAGTTAITVTATASSAVTGDQTVNLGVGGTGITSGDYTLSNNVITIPNGVTSGSVTFTVVDDALVEGTETATLTISNPSVGITLGATSAQNIAIADNDNPASGAAYTLQLLHYYGESGLLGVETAPIMGALIDKFDDQYSNTLVLGEGDSYIPGPWLVGGSDPALNAVPGIGSTALGRPDIAIMNAFGTDASALGNHEFDLGSPVLQSAIAPAGAWVGAQFPLITANLNFSADSSLRGLADATLGGTATNAFAGQEASAIKGKIAPYAVVTQGGEKIGVVGATTYDLLSKSSPNGTVPKDDGIPSTSDLQEVAAYIQAAVDALRASGVNKIVMVDQLDTIERNKALAPLVSGIDVMIAGGGHERMGDATDMAVGFNGHTADFIPDAYPIVATGADGKTTLIVTTDTEYTYLGRLVVDFDANGEIILPNLNPLINGAYASTETNLQAAYGTTNSANQIIASSTIGTQVKAITDAINGVIISKDSNIFGYTNVYLEGDRAFGRAQEVNLGDITADANLFKAQVALGNGAVLASLKNGGGLRASIGVIGEDGEKIPPTSTNVKPAGAISQLDIENALRFDNKLMVFDTTPQGLLNILNYAAGLAPGNGGYAQIGGVRFSYDPTKAVGQRVQDVAIYDLNNNLVAKVADNGVVLPGAPATISVSVLNFTANGGDGYPIKANATNFRYLLSDGTLSAPIDPSLDFTAAANVPTNALGEQKAFQDYLQTFYGTPQTAYGVADTPAALDQRIQNLNVRADTVLGTVVNGASLVNTITVAGNATDLFPTNGGSGGANINRLGGFGSDFFYDYRTDSYYGLADRGPGGGTIPYQTRVEKLSLTVDPNTGAASGFQVVQTIAFYIPAGTTLNGVTYTTDTPFNGLNSKLLPDGGNGSLLAESHDPEGFVVGANGNFFVSDEYGPSIYEFDPTGKFIRAFTPPANVLPQVNGAPYYAGDVSSTTGRQDNRGYEGLAISPDGTKLFAIFQDPLQQEGSGGSNPGRSSRNVRIVRYDVATGVSEAQYIYQLEALGDINNRILGSANDFGATAQGRNIGVSSIVALNNTELLVLERDNRGIGVDPTTNLPIGSKRVYQIDLTGATDVSGISLAGTNTLPADVTPVSKSLFLDIAGELQAAGQTVPEKIEGLAIGPQLADGSFALLVATDNDFSVTQTGSGTQLDVYTDGTQQAIDAPPPASGATLLPSYVYSFKTQVGALDVAPVFDFSTGNYSVTEGNTPGFSTNATVRVTRRGDLTSTDTVQLKLSDGTATGGGETPALSLTTGSSSSQTPYLVPTATGVSTSSILTVGDSIGGYKMVGIPDGLGAFDNGDGTFTLLMNHELGGTAGIARAHGSAGAFVSKWIINKSDLSVVSGSDLIQTVNLWNGTGFTPGTTVFNRFCSADLAPVSAFYDSATGLGTQTRIYLNGEETGPEGRAFGHIVTGANAGTTYQLPFLGKFSWENAVASPTAGIKTVVAGMDDGLNGQVYFYVGTKTNTGTEIDKAGLNNGKLFGIKVAGLVDETNTTTLAAGTRFSLADLGSVENATGAALDAASESAGVTSFLRPEDGAWDPSNPKDFYFTTTNSFIGPSRLWRLRFDDPTNPEAGGAIEMVLDGSEGQKMFDNFTIDRYGHILLQEDIGNQAQIGKIWQYDIATDTLTQLAQHDPVRFTSGSANFLTQDEESSGIIDAQDILGPGWFLLDVQAHYAIPGELVEGGQLLAFFNPDTYKSAVDYSNSPITVTFNPGETFKDVPISIAGDFTPEGNETVNLSLTNPSVGTVIGTKQPNAVLTITNDDQPPSARIHDIQGAAHRSPLVGQNVTNVPGIVTAIASNGFYLQDPTPDNNDATSEGIFVFTSSAPTVAVGDYIQVSGRVTEFRPANNANNLTITEITSPVINKISSGNALPTATILGNGGRAIPTSVIENDASNVETSGIFDPAQDGIDFYESLEGMRVQINNPVATSPTNVFGTAPNTSEEIWVLADNGANATNRTARGGSLINSTDFNPERIQIDDLNNSLVSPSVNVGDKLSTITGVVNYDFSNYEVLVSTAPTVVTPGSLQKEVTNLAPTTNQLTVATFNVENLDPGDGAAKFNALADRIVNNLKSPDILSLEEIQDNNGATNNGVVDASVTYQTLINAIAAAGGPIYEYRQIDPVNNQDGGEPGGNIRVGFLFNPNRVSFVAGSLQRLTDPNPAEVDSFAGDDFANSRKPLVGTFVFNGQEVTVIGNHFNSKGGDQPLFGPNQPPTLNSENQRNQQATIVKNYVQSLLTTNPSANVIVAGDLNDFEFSNPLNILKSAGLSALIETLPANERYTYNFEGNAQTLDHILASNNLLSKLDGFDVVHINSEFSDQVSDHDPSVARFNLPPLNVLPVATNDTATTNEDAAVNISVLTNDTDANGDALQITSVTAPANGTAVIDNNGTPNNFADDFITYTPNPNYNGSDSFAYTISDGKGGVATATVNLTVASVNDVPVVIGAITATTTEDTDPFVVNLLDNATDIDGDPLNISNLTLLNGNAAGITVNGNSLNVNPNPYNSLAAGQSNVIKYNYNITDGNGGNVAQTATITIQGLNDAPLAVTDNVTTTEKSNITFNVLTNDSDPDNGDSFKLTGFNFGGIQGTVSFSSNGSISYNPGTAFKSLGVGQSAASTLSYTITDTQGASSIGTVNITVTGLNDAPVLNPNLVQGLPAILEDPTTNNGVQVLTFLGSAVTDPDANAVQGVAVRQTTGNGTWQYSTNGGSTWTGFGNVSNSAALLLSADTLVRFNPALNFNGTASLNYRAWDQTSGTVGSKVSTSSNGGATAFSSQTATSFLSIQAVDDAPVNKLPASVSVTQGSILTFSGSNRISVSDVDAGSAPIKVTLGVDRGTLSLSRVSGLTFADGDGSNDASMTFTGSLTAINNAINGLRYASDFAAVLQGSATLTITSDDQGASGLVINNQTSTTNTLAITVKPGKEITGTAGNNTLVGTTGSDWIRGLAGNDTLYGIAGSQDILFGGDGNDTIYVGASNAYIDGGLGNDTIYLGGGQAIVALAIGNGTDTINSFSAGSTRFNLTGGLTYTDLAISQSGNNTLIKAGTETLASLTGVQASSLTTNNFVRF